MDGFLKLMKAMKEKGTPGGFALGHATGDQAWAHWLIWAFGGKARRQEQQGRHRQPRNAEGARVCEGALPTFVPGTLSWLDPNNNKAFLDNQISVTNNGISIYYAAKKSPDPKLQEMAKDIQHANLPIGPAGVPTEFQLFFNQMVFKYSKYPKAAKEYIRFMMEAEQLGPWMQSAIGYVCLRSPTRRIRSGPWTRSTRRTANAMNVMVPLGHAGKMGYASAGCVADFIILDMVAEAATGSKTPKEAAERAQKRAERYYKV